MRRAVLAAWDKTGLVDLGRALVDLGWEVVSGGRTLEVLRGAGIPALDVAEVIGLSAMLGGRVKTLHPAIHGAILADRSNAAHLEELAEDGIVPIDLVVTNFYPFADEPSIELIDVGGPAMVRAAAKNHDHVGVLVDPADYHGAVQELAGGALSATTRHRLARKAFAYTAAYDADIVRWLDGDLEAGSGSAFPETLHVALAKTDDLRLGENPHQHAARYRIVGDPGGWWDTATQHHGVTMSYLNLYDADSAWCLVHSLNAGEAPGAVIVKHGNPCGAALGDTITAAWTRAYTGDEVSAYGGIVALNRPVPADLARLLAEIYTLVVVAPGYEPGALRILEEKRSIRIVSAAPPTGNRLHVRSVDGGLLVQTSDAMPVDASGRIERSGWSVVTDCSPTEAEWVDLEFAWRIAARVVSNSIVMVKDLQAVGIGGGQQNRRDAGRIAGKKAAGRAEGGCCASDGFLAFADGLNAVIGAGCRALIQPGGSIRDQEVIDAANDAGLAMVFTGERHFRH